MGLTFIDLFAGIGGFRLGMQMAGHKPLGFVEWDKYARKSYEAMHEPGEEWTAHDIRSVDYRELPRADVWTFGFPCQDISAAGSQKGFGGDRSSLFFSVTRLLQQTKERDPERLPNYLFIENVKNFLSVNDGWDFLAAQIELDEIGYDLEWDVLNSKHFGVPQNRERVFIIGHYRGRRTGKVFPLRNSDRISDSTWVETSTSISALTATDYKGPSKQRPNLVVPVPFVFNRGKVITRENGITTCIDAHYNNFPDTHGQRTGVIDGWRLRKLTPRECWRLQGFPDWAFDRAQAVNSDSQLYKQAGNSVTVNVIYAIASQLI